MVFIAGGIAVGLTLWAYAKQQMEQYDTVENLKMIVAGMLAILGKVKVIGKILLVFLQLVSSHTGGVLNIEWPDAYLAFTEWFSVFDLNLMSFISTGCAIQPNHYVMLVANTAGPIIVCLLIGGYYTVNKRLNRDPDGVVYARCFARYASSSRCVAQRIRYSSSSAR